VCVWLRLLAAAGVLLCRLFELMTYFSSCFLSSFAVAVATAGVPNWQLLCAASVHTSADPTTATVKPSLL
jgi:hypothetical protein